MARPKRASAPAMPIPANDNHPDLDGHTLGALQRAARGDLMPPGESNEMAAITLGRLYRVFGRETDPVLEGRPDWSMSRPAIEHDDEDDDEGGGAPRPAGERYLYDVVRLTGDDELDRATLAKLTTKTTFRPWYNRVTGRVDQIARTYVFLNGRWREYGDYFEGERAGTALPDGYVIRTPKIDATRHELADLDAVDRKLFRDLCGEDTMRTLELYVANANMKEIGEEAGFTGKQAEAVGKFRVQAMVRRAQEVLRQVEAAARAEYRRQLPPTVAPFYPRRRRAA